MTHTDALTEPDNTAVICPACCCQFRAIPVQVQRLLLDAGYEPPFMQDRADLASWVIERWHAEVANRPLVNVHRRSLDDTWRQVLRHLGEDDVAALGPTHDDLLARAAIGGMKP